jgi:hypothetical protein
MLWPIFLFNEKIKFKLIILFVEFTSHFVRSSLIYIANGNDIDIPTIHITMINNIQTPKRIRERNG